jgi:hypothetical protein
MGTVPGTAVRPGKQFLQLRDSVTAIARLRMEHAMAVGAKRKKVSAGFLDRHFLPFWRFIAQRLFMV